MLSLASAMVLASLQTTPHFDDEDRRLVARMISACASEVLTHERQNFLRGWTPLDSQRSSDLARMTLPRADGTLYGGLHDYRLENEVASVRCLVVIPNGDLGAVRSYLDSSFQVSGYVRSADENGWKFTPESTPQAQPTFTASVRMLPTGVRVWFEGRE